MFKLIPGIYEDVPCMWCHKTGIDPKCTFCKGRGLIHQYMGSGEGPKARPKTQNKRKPPKKRQKTHPKMEQPIRKLEI